MKHKSDYKGFTLIELLVVLAIIALLAGLMFGAFTKMRAMADATGCMGNMKTLGTAVQQYTADHDGRMPLIRIQGGFWHCTAQSWCSPALDPEGPHGSRDVGIGPYINYDIGDHYGERYDPNDPSTRLPDVLRCPADRRYFEDPDATHPYLEPSYGCNVELGNLMLGPTYRPQLRFAQIRFPSKFIVLAESGHAAEEVEKYGSGQMAWILSGRVPSQSVWGGRHEGRGHILWADGHVSLTDVRLVNNFSADPFKMFFWLPEEQFNDDYREQCEELRRELSN
ncbi:prepilin-type N-terminal cleavage/methylation domain-containing protein [Kiritimatiella glycovorans]|uniref:Type II secretion system protein G n=1 Tax=Kiritimatiella glycovorans TaxID=1307763 RepID=A0A0G3EK89_9BACT|nr:prepilin-type N-terminal cleavage/methylation domain-containing protein [Kiritimatiella glycovorans]AKJ64584.1 type II secretion system protein G [Kiritimatiella glycovorans]